ncbi:MAG: response regulator [Microthrixaceae bacterium]|nr:response regulator [Microthrixaceae bacterium]
MTARILIAEDEVIIRMDLAEMLVAEGYEVIEQVGRGDEAVERARELRPDLCILDVKMPGKMDGLVAARIVTEEDLAAVVILTSFSQRELIGEAVDVGVGAYVVKPFQASDLVPAIEVALAGRAQMQAMSGRADEAERRLEQRKAIDRAKGTLMDGFGMGEHEAFRFLQTTAMSKRSTMAEVAAEVVAGTLRPGNGEEPPSNQ